MKKQELVSIIGKQTGVRQKDVNKVIDAFSDIIEQYVVGEKRAISIYNFAKFRPKVIKSRKMYNIATGKFDKRPALVSVMVKFASRYRKELQDD